MLHIYVYRIELLGVNNIGIYLYVLIDNHAHTQYIYTFTYITVHKLRYMYVFSTNKCIKSIHTYTIMYIIHIIQT